MRKIILFILIMLLSLPLIAQYDERQILIQAANQHLVRRQYDQAETVFLQILDKYPDDLNAILQLMQIYLNLSASEKAEALLTKYQRVIPEQVYTEQRIQLLVMQGELEQAFSLAESYLMLHAQDQNKYRLIASYFERRGHYESSIRIYQKARASMGDNLFTMEIANAAMRLQRYPQALTEYLAYMANSSNVNLYIKNQIKSIVQADSSLIEIMRVAALNSESDIINELYAAALLSLNRNREALEIYKELPLTYMRDFAREQLKQGHYELARIANRYLAENSPQALQRLTYGYEIARIFHQEALYDSSAVVLQELMDDPFWSQSPLNLRNRLNVNIRKLKAENDLARGEELDQVLATMRQAKEYSTQAQLNQELDLDLAKLSILNLDYQDAAESLSRVKMPELLEKRDYLSFLSAFMQNQSELADSLMHEFVLHHPGGDFANDIIYLNMLSINMEDDQRSTFAQSIRLLQLYNSAGVDSLKSLYDETGDEELLLLAIEWAIGLGDNERAAMLLEHDFSDQLAAEYAQLLSLALISEREDELELAREFLKTKPNSIFSPKFRQVISRQAISQMSI